MAITRTEVREIAAVSQYSSMTPFDETLKTRRVLKQRLVRCASEARWPAGRLAKGSFVRGHLGLRDNGLQHHYSASEHRTDGATVGPTKLVLFDGMPGVGKSSLAQVLAGHLQANDIPTTWHYEEDCEHPLYPFHDSTSLQDVLTLLDTGHHEQVIGDVLRRWQQLAKAIAETDQVVLLDGCLYGFLTWTLFAFDVDLGVIHAYIAAVEAAIAPLQPFLVYLRPDDVEAAMRRVCDRRGGATEQAFIARATQSAYGQRQELTGFLGLVRYWTDFRAFTDTLFQRTHTSKLLVNNTAAAWGEYEMALLAALSLSAATPPQVPAAQLVGLTGAFAGRAEGGEQWCEIRLEGKQLYLENLAGLWSHSRLLPISATHFAVESVPFALTFERTGDEPATAFTLTGPRLLAGSVTGQFLRAS